MCSSLSQGLKAALAVKHPSSLQVWSDDQVSAIIFALRGPQNSELHKNEAAMIPIPPIMAIERYRLIWLPNHGLAYSQLDAIGY